MGLVMSRIRAGSAVALAVSVAMLAACGGTSPTSKSDSPGGDVALTWWHNGTADPILGFWQKIGTEFEAANPGVKIKISPLQNEQFNTKIPVALQSNNPPDLFQQWGGGQMSDQVAAGKLKDISAEVGPELASMGGTSAGWQVKGKTYGLPYTLGVVGFWYNKALFTKAGVTAAPKTMEDLYSAITKLKAAGVTPIAIGAKDKWPAAFYWDYFALRSCTGEVMKQAGVDLKFTDPCWTQAGTHLKALTATKPFQKGFLGGSAQQGAGSSAGLVANGKAAMELMGHWNPSVMTGLAENGKGLGSNLGWFAFPTVAGGKGAPDAALGGGDGFSCSQQAPPACVKLLKYISSVDVQSRFAATNVGLPVASGAVKAVKDPNMANLIAYRDKSSFVQLYLDIAYGNNVGGALNDAVALELAGSATPQDVVAAVSSAAKNK
jgi:raffinose/stachyose/melibiose transport system substrate-binding protein